VRIAQERVPDLILMDIQMPKMDGISALKIIRSMEETKHIPVIALTSYAMKGDRERLIEHGFSAYIAKPIEKNAFIEIIQEALQ
jgi:two-component system cell cycle response regulator DivK